MVQKDLIKDLNAQQPDDANKRKNLYNFYLFLFVITFTIMPTSFFLGIIVGIYIETKINIKPFIEHIGIDDYIAGVTSFDLYTLKDNIYDLLEKLLKH